jgi:hypothetical protein
MRVRCAYTLQRVGVEMFDSKLQCSEYTVHLTWSSQVKPYVHLIIILYRKAEESYEVLQSAVTKWDTDSNGSNGNSSNGNASNANNCNGIDTNGFAAKAGETDAVRCRRLELMEVRTDNQLFILLVYTLYALCQEVDQ